VPHGRRCAHTCHHHPLHLHHRRGHAGWAPRGECLPHHHPPPPPPQPRPLPNTSPPQSTAPPFPFLLPPSPHGTSSPEVPSPAPAKNRATTANPTPVPVSAVEDVPQALVRPTACVGLGLPLSHLRVRPLVCRWRRGFLQAAGRGPYGGNVPRCVGARRSGKRAPSLPPQHSQHSAHRNAPRALVVS
jgi:hypothetical protein